ncbi:MAG: ammonia-forming cytochrome c nitrite reductase subunit c552 [Fibrobacterales bacterium]
MKKLSLTLILAASALFWGCLEGEEGTAGVPGVGCVTTESADSLTLLVICGTDTSSIPLGKNGDDGATGPKGADGVDYVGNGGANCASCHNEGTELVIRQQQYAMSTHATGGHAVRGNSASCAGCHTHEGFEAVVASGGTTPEGVSLTVEGLTQPNCRTCHNIHNAYDSTDWALTVVPTDSVLLAITSTKYAYGTGNVCASCHQPRKDVPVATDSVSVSKYYGPHHGPQSATLKGAASFLFTGDTVAMHATGGHGTLIENTCVTCHMATQPGDITTESGGHQFGMKNSDLEMNLAGCAICHSDADTLAIKITALQTDIQTLIDSVETLLIAKGLATADTSDTGVITAEAVSKKVIGTEAGAVWNYKLILEDQSKGVHNPTFIRSVLNNTIKALNP